MAGMCRRGIRSVGTAGQLLSCLMIVVFSAFVATSQETDPFPNLFRGRNRGSQKRANKSLVVRKRDYLREGTLLRLDPDIWVQDEIDLTLFPTNEEDDDDDTLLVRRFRQNPKDQPTPNQFFGKLVDLDNDRESDFITLVNTTAASSKLSVITGTIHIEGSVYQIRQLPSGEILVENRGKDSDFEEEIEIEEDDNGDDTPNVTAKQGKDSLELHSPLDRRRRVAVDSNASVLPYDINRRQMQQGTDDGSQLDIMVVYSRNAMCAAARHFNNKCVASAENKATIEGIIELAIKEANEAFESSGIDTSLRLVHVHYEDNYDDTAYDWPTVFTHYTGVNDGRLDYIHPMRDQYGADFVSFFVNTRGYCGSAHRPPEPREDRAFSMVRNTGHLFATRILHKLFPVSNDL